MTKTGALNQTFRPQIITNLRVRFDETFTKPGQDKPPKVGGTSDSALLSSYEERQLARLPLFMQQGSDGFSRVIGRVPTAGNIELTGHRQVWKFSFTYAYRDLPVDPRLFRSVGIEIYLGHVESGDYADGILHFEADGSRRSVLQPTDKDLVFIGVVDEAFVEHTAKGSEVHMEGRDLRGMLLGTPIDMKKAKGLNLDQPISKVVDTIIGWHPFGAQIKRVHYPGIWTDENGKPMPEPHPATKGGRTRVNTGAEGQNPQAPPAGAGSGKLTMWDMIVQYSNLVGAIPQWKGDELTIRPNRSIYSKLDTDGSKDTAVPPPFAGGQPRQIQTEQGTEQIRVRRMVYGRDVSRLRIGRKYVGFKAQPIHLVSWNMDGKDKGVANLLEVTYPPNARGKNKARDRFRVGAGADTSPMQSGFTDPQMRDASTSNVGFNQEELGSDIRTIPCPGIRDKGLLMRIARDLFEEISRNELNGSVETKDLTSFGGDASDNDLLRIRPGDTVEIVVDQQQSNRISPLAATYIENARQDDGRFIDDIAARIGDRNLAAAIVATLRGPAFGLVNLFYVHNIKYDWSKDNGLGISLDFVNYVEARHAVQEDGRETAQATRSAVGSNKQVIDIATGKNISVDQAVEQMFGSGKDKF